MCLPRSVPSVRHGLGNSAGQTVSDAATSAPPERKPGLPWRAPRPTGSWSHLQLAWLAFGRLANWRPGWTRAGATGRASRRGPTRASARLGVTFASQTAVGQALGSIQASGRRKRRARAPRIGRLRRLAEQQADAKFRCVQPPIPHNHRDQHRKRQAAPLVATPPICQARLTVRIKAAR